MIRQRLLGLAATGLLLGILLGLPLALLAVGADPVPSSVPSVSQVLAALTSPDDGTLFLQAVTLVGWVAWALLALSIVFELTGRVRGVRAPHLPGLALPQGAAQQLVTAAALLFVVGSTSLSTADTAQADVPAAAPSATATTPTAASAGPHTTTPPRSQSPTSSATRLYTVMEGDSLSGIAQRELGDLERWPEIYALSKDTAQPGGVRLSDPDQIDVGWTLTLPAVAEPRAGTTRLYTVMEGDSLSGIAQRELGDLERWPEIYELSKDTEQPGGVRLSDPNQIAVGWTLTLPSVAEPRPATTGTPRASGRETASRPAPHAAPETTTASGSSPTTAPTQPSVRPSQAPDPSISAPAEELQDDASDATPVWVLAGLSGSGTLLAGSMLLLLRRRRRAQFRHRRPGHTMTAPGQVLGPVEKTVVTIGATSAPTVEYMDTVLRRLASSCAATNRPLPELAAVELTDTAVVLHLSNPSSLDEPWTGTVDGYHWRLPADTAVELVRPDTTDQPAPYPLLVTIGSGDDNELWLLNVEDLNVSITGDPTYGEDFARYLAAEIACNPWSAGVDVACVGVATELAPLNPDRIRAYDPTDRSHDPIAEMLADSVHTIDRARDVGTDAATARAHQAGADTWPARLLLVDAVNDNPALDQLVEVVTAHAGHTATSVVLRGHRNNAPGTVLEISADGRLRLPAAGLDLMAVGLTSDEAQGCAALLAASESVDEVPVPVDQSATQGWQALADEAGALRAEHALPRTDPAGPHEPSRSLLEADDETYLAVAATTSTDLQTLAPRVPETTRTQVEDADPTLDEDLAMWFHQDCALPRLYLLGPVRATTRGKPLTKRKPYLTEMLAFIALRRHGATSAEVAQTFSITKAKARDYVNTIRDWLGINPRTGQPHLPDARLAPAAAIRDTPVYQVLDLLTDADLFRRLRVRGTARGGAAGVEDLKRALSLVGGRPFDYPLEREAGGGWAWLLEGDRPDEQLLVGIVDVAHVVTVHALAAGDLSGARLAAETAIAVAPHEEIARLDMAAVAAAEGNAAEAQRIVRDEVCNRTDDEGVPPELAARTTEILAGHQGWRQPRAS
ncbi:LysM peptidoglycan-binding domain-containing protein [Phycicoccus jejuensis]|uniref:LysM peptidoglycan-binding domain-containing protein n=1 Tax=Phycicoccus jejuensis TaxID=367299 RepID=UPI003850F30C